MSAKVLFWDIETAPILAYVWGTFEQNVSLDQIHTDWHVLAWAAKWKGSKEVMYMDQRNAKDITNDKKILEGLWKLLDEADVVVTQNGIQFDAKKVNARFIEHGMKPPSPYKHVDTLRLAKKQFGFTSNKLAYMTNKLCEKYKKLDHGKFPGFSLWQECLKGNKKAWKEMETYNKHDVLALEELYGKLAPWGAGYDPNLYTESLRRVCVCGNTSWVKDGFKVTQTAKYQKYRCTECGGGTCDRTNLLPPEKVLAQRELQGERRKASLKLKASDSARTCPKCNSVAGVIRSNGLKTRRGLVKTFSCRICQHWYSAVLRPLTADESREKEGRKRPKFDCPKCGRKNTCKKKGHHFRADGSKLQILRCGSCYKSSTVSLEPKEFKRHAPKTNRSSR